MEQDEGGRKTPGLGPSGLAPPQATYIVDDSSSYSMIVQSQVKSDVVVCSIPLLLPELELIVP